jgi:hypothetical protein
MKEILKRLIFYKIQVKKLCNSVQNICNVTDFAILDLCTKVNIRANEVGMIPTDAFWKYVHAKLDRSRYCMSNLPLN